MIQLRRGTRGPPPLGPPTLRVPAHRRVPAFPLTRED